mmetsp:Transcript_16321/g.40646  ORF Transcript_16321/g.40646 Transcript_16321/m.40646 type:complete len:308 (-) Transcript_16321:332-1255(-)
MECTITQPGPPTLGSYAGQPCQVIHILPLVPAEQVAHHLLAVRAVHELLRADGGRAVGRPASRRVDPGHHGRDLVQRHGGAVDGLARLGAHGVRHLGQLRRVGARVGGDGGRGHADRLLDARELVTVCAQVQQHGPDVQARLARCGRAGRRGRPERVPHDVLEVRGAVVRLLARGLAVRLVRVVRLRVGVAAGLEHAVLEPHLHLHPLVLGQQPVLVVVNLVQDLDLVRQVRARRAHDDGERGRHQARDELAPVRVPRVRGVQLAQRGQQRRGGGAAPRLGQDAGARRAQQRLGKLRQLDEAVWLDG